MPLTPCPYCERLTGITPTTIPVTVDELGAPRGSAVRWRLDVHAVPSSDGSEGAICYGSGRTV